MTHVPFTSRLASLIGFPSNSPAPSSPRSDESYIPYTGTYEQPPGASGVAGPSGLASGAPSSSNHARTHTHAHTHSGSTKNTPSNYSITSGHPYNPAYAPQMSAPLAEADESDRERDRGRRLASRRISTSSSFAAIALSSDQHHHHHGTYPTALPRLPPLSTSTVNPTPNARRGGPSYLALDGGFIGQSPVAVVSPKEAGGRNEKSDKSAYRSSFASFITFGNSRKSIASGSGSQGAAAAGSGAWPHSATGVSFPHGASKLRGELRPSAADFYGEDGDGYAYGAEREDFFMRLPPLPPYMRQRSQSYVDQTEQGQEAWRRRDEEERRLRMLQEEMEARALAGRNSVKVTMPTSFFDVSPVEEREGSNPFGQHQTHRQGQGSRSQQQPQAHPYHRHYQPVIAEPQIQHLKQPHDAFDLTSPTTPSFDFLHPYATAPASTNTSPSKSSKTRTSNVGMPPIRPLVLPRKPVPDFQQEQEQQHPEQRHHRERERDRSSTNPFPFVNPFSFSSNAYHHQAPYQASPPPSRPITPKGRLKSLVSLSGEGFRTLKGSISTPNLRGSARSQAAAGQPNFIPGTSGGAAGTQLSHGTTRLGTATSISKDPNDRRPSSSRTAIPPNSVLQGQTLCDTFFLPRPRFYAHQISPPESPYSPDFVKEPRPRRGTTTTTKSRRSRDEHPVQREWDRRTTAATVVAMTRSDPDQERREGERELNKRLGKKKASAPDLRKKPERPVALRDMRRLTEAEKVLLKGEEQDREREGWQRAARGSFQNQRSRSLSRTRTKSIAKASATTSGDEKEREKPSRKNTITVPSSIAVTNMTAPGTGPPTATSSSGAATSGDEGRSNQRDKEAQAQAQSQQRAGVKGSMEYLAAKAFSQGYPGTIGPAPAPTHSRHQSGDVTGTRQQQQRGAKHNNGLGHRRSESWGRSALKMARHSCADPDATSPAIERVFQFEVSAPPAPAPVPDPKVPHDDTVLDIGPNKVEGRPHSDDSLLRPSAIGIAIGTPPLDSLNEESTRIEHPYSSPLGSPIFVGPHPASPIRSLPQLPMMNDVFSRHRLPPRAHPAVSPPHSPVAALASLDAYVPTMEASSQSMLSRESWLVYMNALEEGDDPSRTSKGKGRAVEAESIIYEERPPRDVPEDVDVTMDTPELQLDLGLDGSPAKSMRSRIISARDMEQQLTKAFRRQSANSMSESSENEHASLTFEAGATLSRLLSSRSVTSTPRSGLKRTSSNPETPKVKKAVMVLDPEDPQSTLMQMTSTRPPIPIFEPMAHHRSSSSGRRISGYSDAAGSASGHDSLWRKSVVSSEFAHSPPSQESSPKASPRTLVNLDDLEGYSDLFYTGGHGSFNGRPKSGSSNKTNVSSGLLERALRPEAVTFPPKSAGSSSAAERSFSPPESSRAAASRGWSSGALSPPPPPRPVGRAAHVDFEEPVWQVGPSSKLTEAELERTWDPEEEEEGDEEDSYRIGTTQQPIIVRPTLPIHRHSTKLSVIEGSVDEHATASESTADPEDQESLPATSPTRATIPDAPRPSIPLAIDTLNIPSEHDRRTSSERAVAPEGYARTSMMTNTSGQSRMSDLSDFPVPPIESAAFALTPSDVVQSYFPPRVTSPAPPASPASVLSVEPPSPTAEADETEDQSTSDHHHAFNSLAMSTTPTREYRSNRATFGPDADIARQWTEREHSSTPTTEEH